MAISIVTAPEYPVPARSVTLSFSGASGNYVRAWLTGAPAGSPQRTALDKARRRAEDTPRAAAPLFEGDATKPVTVTFPVGGVYTLAVQEYERGASSHGGGYGGDPSAIVSETLIGDEQEVKIYVGTRMTVAIGAGRYGQATLAIHVWNARIRRTTEAEHGEFTPAIVSGTTDRARNAATAPTMQALLDALDGLSWGSLLNVSTLIPDLADKVSAHMRFATPHDITDVSNHDEVDALPTNATAYSDPEACHVAARVLLQSLVRHMANRTAEGATSEWHQNADARGAPIADSPPGASDPIKTYIALADVHRCYTAHRADVVAHSSADATNVLSVALSPLLAVFAEFLRLLRGDSAAVPVGEHEASVGFARAGFRKG
jgi:hypothetical protein